MKRTLAIIAITILAGNAGLVGNASAQSRARDGATVGGVAGAVIGGIIGHQNDETPEGALIGGAVGAVAGGLLGRSQDEELARQRYWQQQAYYQQQQRQRQQWQTQQQAIVNAGVSANDVAQMVRSGLSESLVISQLHAKGVQRRLEVSEIIALHQQGVSDNIISAMQSAPLAGSRAQASPVSAPSYPYQPRYQTPAYQPSTVIVREQPVFQSPVIYERVYRPYSRAYCPDYSRGAAISIGF